MGHNDTEYPTAAERLKPLAWCEFCQCYAPALEPCHNRIDATAAAKRLANQYALTFAHPAARHYSHLYDNLTPEERAAVNLAVPVKLWQ
jgi:hypothetical protein